MKLESNIVGNYHQQRVIQHLQLTDVLLIFLPMLLVVASIGIKSFATVTGILSEAIIVCAVIVSFILSFIYGVIAFVLSLLTRRNITFRIFLVGFLLLVAGYYALFLK